MDTDGEIVGDSDDEGNVVASGIGNDGDEVGGELLSCTVISDPDAMVGEEFIWTAGDGVEYDTMDVGTVAAGVVSANADVAPLLSCILLSVLLLLVFLLFVFLVDNDTAASANDATISGRADVM